MRSLVRWSLNGLIVAGLTIAVLPLGQSVYGQWNQRQLAREWESQKPVLASKSTKDAPAAKPQAKKSQAKKSQSAIPPKEASDSSKETPRLVTAEERNRSVKPRADWPLTKLSIPAIELETFIVQGWDDAALRRGPGHDPNSSPPGEGNCAIAGHRNTYGSFFMRLDELLPGSEIILENKKGRWVYTVEETFVTPDTNTTILALPPAGEPPILTLVTCTLPHTSNRVVLRARLAEEF